MAKKYVSQIDKQNEPYHIYRQGTSIGTNETGYTLFLNTPNREYNILDEEAYNYRPTGGSLNVGDSEKDIIVGGTLAWNQILDYHNFASSDSDFVSGIKFTNNNDGSVKIEIAEGGATESRVFNLFSTRMTLPEVKIYGGKSGVSGIIVCNAYSTTRTVFSDTIYNNTYTATQQFRPALHVASGTAAGTYIIYPQCLNLTQTLGTTIANHIYNLEQSTTGAGIAYFKKYFPKIYYQYSVPTLQNVCVSKHIMTEFNLWDEEWEIGAYDTTTGNKNSSTTQIRCKNLIKVKGGTTYHATVGLGGMWGMCYDSQGNILYRPMENQGLTRSANAYQIGSYTTPVTSFTVPENCYYISFYMTNGYGTTYNHDICINISYPSLNGTYKPYKKYEYNINPNKVQLRGLYKLDTNNNLYCYGDIWYGDSRIERKFGVVDLGTLTWNYNTTYDVPFFLAYPPGAKGTNDAICSKYPCKPSGTYTTLTDKQAIVYGYSSGYSARIAIRDDSYTDAATFKAAMSGVMLVYELATPYIEIQNRYENTQNCNNAGTEQYTDALVEDGTRDVEIPVGHLTTYDEPREDLQKLS